MQPHAVSSPVSSRTLGKLEAGSSGLDELALKRNATGFETKITWDAPASVEVPMLWSAGLPHVMARVNGQEVKLIIDTGSQGTVLEADTALRCAVGTVSRNVSNITLSGISGSEPALLGVPRRVEIADWHWEGVPCLVRTSRSEIAGEWLIGRRRFSVNVLGMDVLMRMCSYVTLDYPAAKVIFGFHQMFQPGAGRKSWSVPMEIKGGIPFVRVGDGHNEWQAVIDTGASTCAEIGAETTERFGLSGVNAPSSLIRMGVGSSKKAGAAGLGTIQINSLELLGPRILKVPALLVPDWSKIGSGLFRPFRVTLDFKRSLFWLESATSNS
ncbi:MAG: retroviral-like aspartic protease family protein [Verrucomicrobia bacterium]|nr:retroviral-like aspartic protease family protein [Verrucomicrobiota bacterium]